MCFKFKKLITFGFLGVGGLVGSQLWIPYLLGTSVDRAYEKISSNSTDFSILWILASLIIFVSVLRGIFAFLLQYNGEKIANGISADLRNLFHKKLQSQTYKYHDRIHTGNLMSRGILDIEGVKMFVTTGLLRTFEIMTLIFFGSYLLLRTDLQIGLIAFGFIIPVALIATISRLRLRKIWNRIQKEFSILNTNLQENLIGVKVVRAFGGEDYEVKKFRSSHRQVTNDTMNSVKVDATGTSLVGFFFLLVWAFIIWVGGHKIIDGELTIGELTQCLVYLGMLQRPVRIVGLMVNSYARAITCGLRLFEILDSKPRIATVKNSNSINKIESLKFEDVGFKYYFKSKKNDVNKINLDLKPGKIIGIIGPPGSGKSTIANLIPRFYDVLEGQILINETPLKTLNLNNLRSRIGLVSQHTFLFNSTLKENIAYSKPDSDLEDVIRVAKIADIHEFIDSLPEKYETMVGEFGVSLSGGQKQRIAIARNLFKNPDVLIFDDSFSALDTGTDKKIRERLVSFQENRSTLIVSQRVSTISHSDEIIVLDQGNIVDRGKHEDLVNKDGIYKTIFELQNPKMQVKH
ncbi:MAG: ABC transporter ATP-binding protein [Chloroflexota bacterium]|nr:ABC transporter ATP-binding protein [Chloroflexota bacterium]MEC8440064.1 ABC transporter ATP-binding protein [Chloroflexota bacterium]